MADAFESDSPLPADGLSAGRDFPNDHGPAGRTGRTGLLWAGLTVSSVVAVVALAVAALLWTNHREQLDRLTEIELEAAQTGQSLDTLRTNLQLLDGRLGSVDGALGRLERRTSSLETTLATSAFGGSAIDELERDVMVLDRDLGLLTRCVNDYMETIGNWSTNVNSYYSYFLC